MSDDDLNSIFEVAVLSNDLATVESFLSSYPYTVFDPWFQTLFAKACQLGHTEIVKYFLDHPHILDPRYGMRHTSMYRDICDTAYYGHLETVNVLLADPRAKKGCLGTEERCTMVLEASLKGGDHIEQFAFLFNHPMRKAIGNYSGQWESISEHSQAGNESLMRIATNSKQIHCLEYLLENTEPLYFPNILLSHAARTGSVDLVDLVLSYVHDIVPVWYGIRMPSYGLFMNDCWIAYAFHAVTQIGDYRDRLEIIGRLIRDPRIYKYSKIPDIVKTQIEAGLFTNAWRRRRSAVLARAVMMSRYR
jgi:hypothetical protein